MISKLSAQKCCTIIFGAFLMPLAQLKRAAMVQQFIQLKAHVNLAIKTFLTVDVDNFYLSTWQQSNNYKFFSNAP